MDGGLKRVADTDGGGESGAACFWDCTHLRILAVRTKSSRMGWRNWSSESIISSFRTSTFQFNKYKSCLSIKLMSLTEKRPSVYLAQWMFLGDESLWNLALRIKHERRMR